MLYEWDEKKRQRNLAKHGVDFSAIEEFDWANALRLADNRQIYGETRSSLLEKSASVCMYVSIRYAV